MSRGLGHDATGSLHPLLAQPEHPQLQTRALVGLVGWSRSLAPPSPSSPAPGLGYCPLPGHSGSAPWSQAPSRSLTSPSGFRLSFGPLVPPSSPKSRS